MGKPLLECTTLWVINTKFNVMLKAIINNTRLIACCVYPTPQAIGTWLRRLGKDNQGIKALRKANKTLLKATLNNCKNITLDIDASEVIANKADAQWTYKGNKGYMPMVGHIAQTGQIVATDFRAGNVSPNTDNLGFIKTCQDALPKGTQGLGCCYYCLSLSLSLSPSLILPIQ
jgi:hypothetical protein